MKKETETSKKLNSHAACFLYDQINQAQSLEQLDQLAKLMWQGNGEGEISDEDATILDETVRRRRPLSRVTAPGFHRPIGPTAGRIGSRFKPRRLQRSPDRQKSIERRRMLAASSSMPPKIRGTYTEGERAALCVIAGEVKRQGICDWPLAKIAALAGVSRSTLQNALRKAHGLGHAVVKQRPVPGRKNLSNIVSITSQELLAWINRAPSAAKGIGFNSLNPTKNIEKNQEERRKEATEEEPKPTPHKIDWRARSIFVNANDYRGGKQFQLYWRHDGVMARGLLVLE